MWMGVGGREGERERGETVEGGGRGEGGVTNGGRVGLELRLVREVHCIE